MLFNFYFNYLRYDIDTNNVLDLIDRWVGVVDGSKLGKELKEDFMENRRNIEILKRRKNE